MLISRNKRCDNSSGNAVRVEEPRRLLCLDRRAAAEEKEKGGNEISARLENQECNFDPAMVKRRVYLQHPSIFSFALLLRFSADFMKFTSTAS
jgi:hypothetical protein